MYERKQLKWNGWGLKDISFNMKGRSSEVWRYLTDLMQESYLPQTEAVDLDHVKMPACRISDAVLTQLCSQVGEQNVKTDNFERALHAFGRSFPDLIRLRSGQLETAPDAVVYPRSDDDVEQLLSTCTEHGIAVVPFGGGTSVVGGVEALAGGHHAVITLDTTKMKSLLDLDSVSKTATFQAGVYGPELERILGEHGYTLGHYPQSFEFSTLGGWIVARGSGQQCIKYGGADKFLVSARLITPEGRVRTLPFPKSAAGPDINQLVAGSEGTLGILTEATVRIHELPEDKRYCTYLFKDFESGTRAIRRIAQEDIPIAMARLSDEPETAFYSGLRAALSPQSSVEAIAEKALGVGGYSSDDRCVMMIGFEGDSRTVKTSFRRVLSIALSESGLYVGEGPGKTWYENRFHSAYLRDAMLDRGIGIDTLETSTEWSNVPRLYREVQRSLTSAIGPKAQVLCHISHSYPNGCSLYFIFLFMRDLKDELGQWQRIKNAASQSISDNGGTISHHHGVGKDHLPWMAKEKGELGMNMLRATKKEVDPKSILNPGKLID